MRVAQGRPGAALQARVVVERGDFRLDVAVDAVAGEVVGVLGPNGAGKSTLLRALAGLTPLTSGRVVLGGQVLDDPAAGVLLPAGRRPVALVFQDLRLFPHLDVLDNVAFSRRSAGAPRRAARAHALRWLERLDLAALAARRPAALSGGQAQRVALARALASEPGLLLLDEPLSALDVQVRQELRTALRGDLAHAGGPTLVVTHDPLEAMVLADRLLVVEGGVVVQTGAPADVARRPATGYVARLVGLNLYRGVRRTTGGAVELDGGGTLVAAGEDRPGRLLVAVRPAAVTLHPGHPGAASARNVWHGVVAGLALLGDRVRVDVRGRPDVLVDLTPAAVAELALRPGAQVWLTAKATDVLAYAQG